MIIISNGGCGGQFLFSEASRLGLKPGRRPGKRYSDNRSFFQISTSDDINDLRVRTEWGRFRRCGRYTNYENFIEYLQWKERKNQLVSLNFYNYFGKIYDRDRDLGKYESNLSCPLEVIENQGRILYETDLPCIYLIRHPLQQYLSFGKRVRHGKDLDRISASIEGQGIHSEISIKRYMNDWNEQIDHYENNPNEKYLIRFEFVTKDISVLDHKTSELFRNWNSELLNPNILNQRSTEFLKENVIDAYLRHYERWDLFEVT